MNHFLTNEINNQILICNNFVTICTISAKKDDNKIDKNEKKILKKLDKINKKYIKELKKLI